MLGCAGIVGGRSQVDKLENKFHARVLSACTKGPTVAGQRRLHTSATVG